MAQVIEQPQPPEKGPRRDGVPDIIETPPPDIPAVPPPDIPPEPMPEIPDPQRDVPGPR